MRSFKDIELIALDMDGTLLDENHQIPLETVELIKRARELDVVVMIASGRMYRSIKPHVKRLALEGPVMAYNGAMIKNWPDEAVIAHEPLSAEVGQRLLDLTREGNYHLHLYLDDILYVKEMNERVREYCKIAGVEATPLGREMYTQKGSPTKLLFYEDLDRLGPLRKEIEEMVGDEVYLTSSFPFFLEVTRKDVNKGTALLKVMEYLGLSSYQVAAVGDSGNDVAMLETAGIGVAVANAKEEIRTRADMVTIEPGSLGVQEVLRAIIRDRGGDS